MKPFLTLWILLVGIHAVQAQGQEFTIGINHNHFYDFQKKARRFESADKFGISLGWSLDHINIKSVPIRLTLKLDHYEGHVNIFNGGLGGGGTLDADVSKNMIAIGLYPLNFKIKQVLHFNFGVECNALILEKATGSYYYYQGGLPPISYTRPLDDGANKISYNFGLGLTGRVAYYLVLKKGWSLVPQYQVFAGMSDEFKNIESETRSFRHYLAIGIAKRAL